MVKAEIAIWRIIRRLSSSQANTLMLLSGDSIHGAPPKTLRTYLALRNHGLVTRSDEPMGGWCLTEAGKRVAEVLSAWAEDRRHRVVSR